MGKSINIWTDGSCPENPGPGGWAFVIPELDIKRGGHIPNSTNNIAELTAIIEAMKWAIDNNVAVKIHSDSQYCVKGFNGWMKNWAKGGWKKPKKNKELWMQIHELKREFRGSVKWVKGHNDCPHNDSADLLAGLYATNLGFRGVK